MKKCILTIVLCVLTNVELSNAENLTGRVVDKNEKGLPDVTIRLLQSDSTFVSGTITDSLGNYRLTNLKLQNYLLSVSSIGYVSRLIPISIHQKEQQMMPVVLVDKSVDLDEVTVRGKSFLRQKDRVLIFPDKQQIKHAATGYDVLYNLMIPGLTVDRRKGNVSTFNGEVSLYINGQKADYREVQALRPRDIGKVEYFDMPTGTYAGDKASINYITKERKTGGYVSLDANQTLGYLNGDYNMVAKVSRQNTSYTLFAGHAMTKYDGIQNEKIEHFHFPTHDISRITTTDDALTKKNNQYVQWNVENSNDKRILTGKLSFVHENAPGNYSQTFKSYADMPDKFVKSRNETDQHSLMPGFNLYGNFHLTPKQTLQVTLLGTYTQNQYERNYTEDSFRSATKAIENLYSVRLDANYNMRLKHQNSLGLQLGHIHQISSSDYSGDYDEWTHLWTGETLVMAQYNQNFGKNFFLSLQLGGDILLYRLHGYECKRYVSPHANVMMNYRLSSSQSLLFALNTGNSNPPIDWLNDIDQNIDSLQKKRGNPYLKKANYYISYLAYSLQAGKFNIQLTGYYMGAIPTSAYDYFVEGDKLITGFSSDGDYHAIRSGLSITYPVNSHLRIQTSGFYHYYKSTGKIKAEQSNWGGSVDVNYFWKDFTFNMYGKSTTKTVSMQPVYTRSPALYGAFVRWSHKGWIAEVGTDSPFNKHNRKIEHLNTSAYQFYNREYSRIFQQTGYIKLAYTFDFGRKTLRAKDKVNTDMNSGILKAE